jgi:hypothetical protein
MKSIKEGSSQLVITGGDGAVDLEVADHALDAVAFSVDASVPADRGLAMGSRWDGGTDALLAERAADGIGVIALVGEQVGRTCLGKGDYGFERRAVRRLAAGEMEDERDALGITETMNFTGEPAPRAAKSLFASPPLWNGPPLSSTVSG